MKTKRIKFSIIIAILILVLVPGCVVISFYPLYEKDDLFANDIMLGKWLDKDSTLWTFNFPHKKQDGKMVDDSLGYILHLTSEDGTTEKSSLLVHLIKLGDNYFLDFYIDDYDPTNKDRGDFVLFDMHLMPVHTFAKLTAWNDSLYIEWFDPDWLDKQISENKVRIRHEKNEENTLLTARPHELKEFVKKYGHIQDAYGMDVKLFKLD
ncbi:hypothetical protein ACE1ET_13240 [Saccharicrinis sp. FJH62]|uniref:hypothetical protein n=1 Tax=Saccharicrinis sp. FJH62 TaxID=3344657 RepID=UPI0035D4BC52